MSSTSSSLLLHHAALEQAPFGVLLLAADGVLYINRQLRQLFQLPDEAESEQPDLDSLFTHKGLSSFLRVAGSVLDGTGGAQRIELMGVRGDGELLELDAEISPVIEGGQTIVMAVLRDAAARHIAEQTLNRLAFHDSLTGLPNRALFLDRLNQSLRCGKRHQRGFSLLCVDLDGFKAVNDEYGHEAGDAVLRAVAGVLQRVVRESDTVARLGGDEFAIILNDTEGGTAALHVADHIHAALCEGLRIANMSLPIGASVGIASYPEHGADMHSLIVAADAAMYDAKRYHKGTSRYTEARREGCAGLSSLALQWSGDFEFGVAQIDTEHKGMLEAINDLVGAFSAAEELQVIRHRMDTFINLAASHFRNEEAYMGGLSQAERIRHRQEHVHAVSELKRLREALEVSGISQTIQFISNWLFDHVRESDRHLCQAYLANQAS